MRELFDAGASEAVSSPVSLRGFCGALVAGVPGGAALVFDRELRVWFAEGAALARSGVGPMVGRRLPDLMRAESWNVLKEPYEAAVEGSTTRFDLAVDGTLYSVRVSPIVLPGDVPGALAVSREISAAAF